MLSVIMLNENFIYCYAECHYSECCYAECYGAPQPTIRPVYVYYCLRGFYLKQKNVFVDIYCIGLQQG